MAANPRSHRPVHRGGSAFGAPAGYTEASGASLASPETPANVWLYTHQEFSLSYKDDQVRALDARTRVLESHRRGRSAHVRAAVGVLRAPSGGQVIEVNLTSSDPIQLVPREHMIVRFAYSVTWKPSSRDFATRFDRYLDQEFFEHKVLRRFQPAPTLAHRTKPVRAH